MKYRKWLDPQRSDILSFGHQDPDFDTPESDDPDFDLPESDLPEPDDLGDQPEFASAKEAADAALDESNDVWEAEQARLW